MFLRFCIITYLLIVSVIYTCLTYYYSTTIFCSLILDIFKDGIVILFLPNVVYSTFLFFKLSIGNYNLKSSYIRRYFCYFSSYFASFIEYLFLINFNFIIYFGYNSTNYGNFSFRLKIIF